MIERIKIRNFKSIVDLTLELGRFNVIIGANGCGKTNILEAITFASATSQNKLDTEYLINRDIRISEPQFIYNAFAGEEDAEDESTKNKIIQIDITAKPKIETNVRLLYDEPKKQWVNLEEIIQLRQIQKILEQAEKEIGNPLDIPHTQDGGIDIVKLRQDYPATTEKIRNELYAKPELSTFLTYHPSDTFLRKVFETTLFPFGIKGDGLLRYLKDLDKTEKSIDLIRQINEGLHLLDWFEEFSIPEDLLSNEYKLSIGDKYLKESMHYFDQRSTNEGFLYLLFYLTLFNSTDTPPFFAIDNIETALNPKLCTKLTEHLIGATLKNNKQIILTTHSPYVLDGLDLSNEDIRLFVARRNIDGHTKIERIDYRENRNMLLSELWMSGLIGGLPDNF